MQIASLKEKMTGLVQPEIVFMSPMQRCRESAQILFPDREKIEIPEWKEMNFGAFEGKNYEQLNGNPQYQAWIDSNGTLPFPEGESRAEFIDRVCAGMDNAADYLRNYAQSNLCRDCGSDREVTVAAVVHGGTIMALLSHYGGGDYYNYQVENANRSVLLHRKEDSDDKISYNCFIWRFPTRSACGRSALAAASDPADR